MHGIGYRIEANISRPNTDIDTETVPDQHPESAADETKAPPGERAFRVRLALTGGVYPVPAHKSIIEVLRENGVHVDTSCEEGYCGTCMTRYLGGEPEHRDMVLDEEDRASYVLICCARSKTDELVLDL